MTNLPDLTDRASAFVPQIFLGRGVGVVDPVEIFLSSSLHTEQNLVVVCHTMWTYIGGSKNWARGILLKISCFWKYAVHIGYLTLHVHFWKQSFESRTLAGDFRKKLSSLYSAWHSVDMSCWLLLSGSGQQYSCDEPRPLTTADDTDLTASQLIHGQMCSAAVICY